MNRTGRVLTGLLLTLTCATVRAEVNPNDRAERWWDASRADRIRFSDRAAAQCRSPNCDSLQIRSCLNDTLKPPVPVTTRNRTIAEVTAICIAGFRPKQ